MSSANRDSSVGAPAVSRPSSESLQKLKRGELTLDQYLDEAVERAIEPVRAWVSADTLENFRETLRESVRTDPVLVKMVETVTGCTPTPEVPRN